MEKVVACTAERWYRKEVSCPLCSFKSTSKSYLHCWRSQGFPGCFGSVGKEAMVDKLCEQKQKDSGCLLGIFHPVLMGSKHNLAAGYCTAWNFKNKAECNTLQIGSKKFLFLNMLKKIIWY